MASILKKPLNKAKHFLDGIFENDGSNEEPGRVAQKLLDSIVKRVLQSKREEANTTAKGSNRNAYTDYRDIMNVSDYHILYNYFKIRLDIARYEKEHLGSLVNILYDRGRDLITDPFGVTRGRIELLNRTMLHDVMSFHRDEFHEETSKFDCGCLLIKMLLSYNANVNAKDKYGTTPFHEAAANHCERTMEMLLNTGLVDVNQTDHEGDTALFYLVENIINGTFTVTKSSAVVKRLDNCLRLLLKHGLDFRVLGKYGNSAFHKMLSNYYMCLQLVITFVEMCSPDVSLRNQFGYTAIHVCVMVNNQEWNRERTDILRYLCILSSRETLNIKDLSSKTPLVHTILYQNKIFTRILVSNGANINMADKHGLTPLHYACMEGNMDLLKILLDCNANIEAKDFTGDVPLVYAAAHGRIEVVKMMYPKYQMSQELYSRLLVVSDFNNHRGCYENIKMIKEWDVIELETKHKRNQKIKTREVEVELREVGAWLKGKRDHLRKHRRLYFISPLEKFYILSSLREQETNEVKETVIGLMNRISKRMSIKTWLLYSFTPVLSGSMAEETNIGQVENFEFICEMTNLVRELEMTIEESDSNPGYLNLKVNPLVGISEELTTSNILQTVGDNHYISWYNLCRNFLEAVTSIMCDESVWERLHLSWNPTSKQISYEQCTLSLNWVGQNYKYKSISINLIPTIKLNINSKTSLPLQTLTDRLGVSKKLQKIRLVPQNDKSCNVDRPDLYWKETYKTYEKIIFESIPDEVLEGYKLTKLIRSEQICPRIFTVEFPKSSLRANEYLPTYLLKTCLFYELKSRLDVGGLELIRNTDAIGWANNILNRLENFIEMTSVTPDFFDQTINLRDERIDKILQAICKIGKNWLQYQWEDIYEGCRPPVVERLIASDTSSPEL